MYRVEPDVRGGRMQVLAGPGPPGLLGNLTVAGSCRWVLLEGSTLRFMLWKDPSGLQCQQEWERGLGGGDFGLR